VYVVTFDRPAGGRSGLSSDGVTSARYLSSMHQ
jgi:hypothetical protein